MPRRPTSKDRKTEAARYRRAANETLTQLEWAIDYLSRIRKTEIARALRKNARHIANRLH
jgi:hypothetical protein